MALGIVGTIVGAGICYFGFAYLMGARPKNARIRKSLNRGFAALLLVGVGLAIWAIATPSASFPYHGSGRQEHSTDPFTTTATTQP